MIMVSAQVTSCKQYKQILADLRRKGIIERKLGISQDGKKAWRTSFGNGQE